MSERPIQEYDLTELSDALDKAQTMVVDLCRPRNDPQSREWIMRIPAQPDYDPDLVIAHGLSAGNEAIRRVRELFFQLNKGAEGSPSGGEL